MHPSYDILLSIEYVRIYSDILRLGHITMQKKCDSIRSRMNAMMTIHVGTSTIICAAFNYCKHVCKYWGTDILFSPYTKITK